MKKITILVTLASLVLAQVAFAQQEAINSKTKIFWPAQKNEQTAAADVVLEKGKVLSAKPTKVCSATVVSKNNNRVFFATPDWCLERGVSFSGVNKLQLDTTQKGFAFFSGEPQDSSLIAVSQLAVDDEIFVPEGDELSLSSANNTRLIAWSDETYTPMRVTGKVVSMRSVKTTCKGFTCRSSTEYQNSAGYFFTSGTTGSEPGSPAFNAKGEQVGMLIGNDPANSRGLIVSIETLSEVLCSTGLTSCKG